MSDRQFSTFRKGQFTTPHLTLLNILGENHVAYLAEEVIHIPNEYDLQGRPVAYKVDVFIVDPRYWQGVIEVDGRSHLSKDTRNDAIKKLAQIDEVRKRE